jgi:phosphoglycerate dehydrogenase-like enzyme
MSNVCVVWLEWPEKCFRVDAGALSVLKACVPAGTRVVRARTEAGFLRALPAATHVIVWHFDPAWFSRAPRLRLVATPAAGREYVPAEGPAGVTIHFGAFHGPAMAESVLALMLAWCRGVVAAERLPHWPKLALSERCYRLAGTRAVILGYGRIGRTVGSRLAALGVEVTGVRRRNAKDLPRLLPTADWLICALPGDTGTDRLLDGKMLARLPKRAVVVNVGRGNVIDEEALARALSKGQVAAALLDVWQKEPLPVTSALGRPETPNVVRMPHAAAFYPAYLADCFRELAQEGLLS